MIVDMGFQHEATYIFMRKSIVTHMRLSTCVWEISAIYQKMKRS